MVDDMLRKDTDMTKKFDVVIGNPPYQEEAQGGGTRDTPVYHLFMDAAYEVGTKAVLITPARFLFNAGFTPKAWNEKMLADQHLTVPHYVPNSDDCSPARTIKGGIAVTYRDADHARPHRHLHEVPRAQHDPAQGRASQERPSSRVGHHELTLIPLHRQACTRTTPKHSRCDRQGNAALVNTNAFEQFSFLFSRDPTRRRHEYVRVLGVIKNKRYRRWIRSDYITGPESFDKYKVVGPGGEREARRRTCSGSRWRTPTSSSPELRSHRRSSPSARSTPRPRRRRA